MAIAYFATIGATVSLPLTDSQEYDLIADVDGKLSRVQVKTTNFVKREHYYVELRTKGGNKSGTGKTKKFDPSMVDQLFILTGDGKQFLVPTKELKNINSLTLTEKYVSVGHWQAHLAVTQTP